MPRLFPALGLSLLLLPCASRLAAESALLVPIVQPAAPDLTLASPALFVAPDGSDTHDGRSPATPLATIQRAADLAQPGDTIHLRAGTYRESVRPARSGTEDKLIAFTSYPGERAVISGADLVTAPFTKRSDDIYAATLPDSATYQSAHNFALQVFVDGEMIHLARWPDLGGDISRPIKSAITEFVSKIRDNSARLTTGVVADAALASANIPAVGAEIFFQPNIDAWSWAFTGRVTAQSADGGRLTFTSRNDAGKDGGTGYPVGSRYILFNSPALLDAPGEWYLDRDTRTLALITPTRADPARHRVEIKRRDWAFDLDGLSHLVIRDLDLFACSITTDRAAGGDGIAHEPDGRDRFPWRGRDSVAPASDIVLSGLRATYLTHFTDTSGHFFMQWGQGTGIVLSGTRLTLRDSVLRFSAGNGVTVLGRANRVLNNLILDTAYAAVECAAINTGGAAPTLDHEFAYNTIARCGRSGITPRLLANSDPARPAARIHHNDIFHCMLQDWDGGALYAAVTDAKFVRIDHNLAHDIDGFNTSGLYTDFAKNYVFDHNLIWNTEWGFQFQGDAQSHGKKVNNTLVYHNTVVVTNTSGAPYGPFNFAGSRGENNGTVIANNLLAVRARTPGWKPFASAYTGAEIADNLVWDGTADAATNPRFADLAAADFTLAPDSPALGKARPLAPVERDGMAAAPFAADTPANPDLGAFRSGAPAWQAGCNLPERATLAPWGPAVTRGKKR
jgi:hypothetical protein